MGESVLLYPGRQGAMTMDASGPALFADSGRWLLAGLGLLVGLVLGGLLGWLWRRRGRDEDAGEEAESLRQRLQRAQRMEALGILSGSIMHNLNNLLSVVLGQARLARDDVAPDSPAWRSLGQVIQAGEAAAQLSREVDSYHREADHTRRPIRLQPVVRATVKLLRDILPDTVSIETDLDPACGPVLASTAQVQQIIMSLCSNAYHAMYRRRGRITISMQHAEIDVPRPAIPRELAEGVYVRLSVADNGRGMDEETLAHIFEPYFSARAPQHGAGLGLTMVSRLLTANEGVTIPSSLPGHGTRFDLYFPLIARGVQTPKQATAAAGAIGRAGAAEESPAGGDRSAGADATRPAPASGPAPAGGQEGAPAPGPQPIRRRRPPTERYELPALEPVSDQKDGPAGRQTNVLLVEDDTMVAETVRACLERAGLAVSTHEDGAAAVSAFAADPGRYDLLLTDQFMRGLDGREVVREVRRYRPRIPVILMSGHPEGIRPEEVQELGVAATLAKPFTPARLLEAVRQALAPDEPRARESEA